jgi:hypothetical protein
MRLLETFVVLTLRMAAWLVVSLIAAVFLSIVVVATIAATAYAKSCGVPPLAVDIPVILVGLVLTIVVVREFGRLREIYAALAEDRAPDE